MSKKHILLINILIFGGVAVFYFLRSDKNYKTGVQVNREVKNTLQARMNAGNYEALQEVLNRDNLVGNSASFQEILDQEKRDKLTEALKRLLRAYSVGTYEAYSFFRFPSNTTYTFNKIVLDQIRSVEKDRANGLSPEDLVKLAVERYSRGKFYSNYFHGLIIDAATIAKVVGSTNEFYAPNVPGVNVVASVDAIPMDNPSYCLTNYITLGVKGPLQLIHIEPSPSDILAKGQQVLYANVYWLVKPDPELDPDSCFPLLCQFYWAESSRSWLPAAVTRANVWKDRKYKSEVIF